VAGRQSSSGAGQGRAAAGSLDHARREFAGYFTDAVFDGDLGMKLSAFLVVGFQGAPRLGTKRQ
jgi:hypothetical protein